MDHFQGYTRIAAAVRHLCSPCPMPRNDPTDTGGLFIGRRPGTAPLRYRVDPERGSKRRRRTDATLAALVLVLESLVCLTLWGPQPVAWLWIGSQIDYRTDSITLALAVTFFGMIATLMVTLGIATRLDRAWRILRRAAGHDQQEGVLPRIFAVTAIVALVLFSLWFVIIEGPAPSLAPR
jgi:hypothetical protein